jgi:hypothetical protein
MQSQDVKSSPGSDCPDLIVTSGKVILAFHQCCALLKIVHTMGLFDEFTELLMRNRRERHHAEMDKGYCERCHHVGFAGFFCSFR